MTLDVFLIEKSLAHASLVQLVRLTSTGRTAFDFPLACFIGRETLVLEHLRKTTTAHPPNE